MTTLSNNLCVAKREAIIQAQEPVPADPDHHLYTLCEIIAREEAWYVTYRMQGRDVAAQCTENFLNGKREQLREMLHSRILTQVPQL